GNGNSDLLWMRSDGATQIWQINGSQVAVSTLTAPTGDTLHFGVAGGSTNGTPAPSGAETASAAFNSQSAYGTIGSPPVNTAANAVPVGHESLITGAYGPSPNAPLSSDFVPGLYSRLG